MFCHDNGVASVRRSFCKVIKVHVGSQRFALHVEDKGRIGGVPVWHFRGVDCTTVREDLVGLPSRVGLVQDVQDGGLHVTQYELSLMGLDREEELGGT